MTSTWTALADPHRRAMLELLREAPRPVSELVAHTGLSQPGTSKHLRVLREAGLVVSRTEAQRRIYALDVRPLVELDAWIEPYRRRWERSLDALERHLDRTSTPTPVEG
ncbi:MAG: winged helix-turn-helix transcriptional regulator [Solirubrobacterales bacterium]|nr:winged helix-turn-helix transcriptional regulator [Solirubrobacterales bacterium]